MTPANQVTGTSVPEKAEKGRREHDFPYQRGKGINL